MSLPGESDSQSLLKTEILLAIYKKLRRGRGITEEERISQIADCLEDGFDIDTRLEGKGETVLHIAIGKGYEKVVKFLRQRGARIDICNDEGLTAITLAERFDNPRIASILREPVRRELAEGNDDNDQPSTPRDGALPSFSHSSQTRIIDNQGVNPDSLPHDRKRQQSDINDGYDKSAMERRLDSKEAIYTDFGGDLHLGESTRSSRYDDEETYPASGLKRSPLGTVYWLKYLMLIVHRLWKKKYSFRLSTGMDATDKFDDLVLEYEDSTGNEVHRFIHLKHKANDSETIKASDLRDTEDGDFSVLKYFSSWRKIRNHPNFRDCESQKFILCTNIDLDEKGLRSAGILIEEIQEPDDLLGVKNRPKQPPRYKLLVGKSSELWNTLKSSSDIHHLANVLAERVHKDEQIDLTANIFKDYHVALAKEVIDIGRKKFSDNFIKNKNLSPEAEKFREIFFMNTKHFLQKNTSEEDICEGLGKRVLKLSTTFGRKFQPLARPGLSDVEKFSRKFVVLLHDSIDNAIEIYRQKDASASASEKKFSDDIAELAGHVLIEEEGKIKFRQQFLDDNDDIQLSGNLEQFKAVLKLHLAEKFDELVNFEFEINRFKTCTEEELSVKTQLPNDEINDKDILDFAGNFILAVKQPNEIELGEMIKSEMGACSLFNLLNADFIMDSFQSMILDWFKTTKKPSPFLNHVKAKEFFQDIETKRSSLVAVGLNLPYPAEIETFDIRYKKKMNDLQNFLENSDRTEGRILQMISPTQTFLTALRVYQTLKLMEKYEKNGSFILIRLDKLWLSNIETQVLGAFESQRSHDLLVIDCGAISQKKQGGDIYRLWDELGKIVERNSDKRMILIIQGDKYSAVEFQIDSKICHETDDDIGIDNLHQDSRRRLLQNEVIRFQGREERISFERLLNIGDSNDGGTENSTSLGKIIDPNTLIKLIKNKEVQIGDQLEGLGDAKDYYIPRTIVQRVVIRDRILNDQDASELFAISNIDDGALRRLVAKGRGKFRMDFGEPKKHVILNSGKESEEFKTLCDKHSDRNVHWLEGGTGKLIWIKTSGNISHLLEFKDKGVAENENIEWSKIFTEEQLVADDEQRIVIISDVAGMGKSTVLTHLGSIMKERKSNMLVIRINLTQHTKALARLAENQTSYRYNTEGAVDFLVDELLSLKNISESQTFKTMIKERGEAALLFDGFDEISPNYEYQVIRLLQALAKCPIKKLFVTTRPRTRNSLEKELGIFAHLMLPFSEENQIDFLTKFWAKGPNRSDVPEYKVAKLVEQHAKAVMKLLAESINQSMNEFMGVPLQTRLVAEVFPYGKDEKLPESIDIINLYEQFFDRKYEIFSSEKKSGDATSEVETEMVKRIRPMYFMRHQKLALDLLFHESIVAKLLDSQPYVSIVCNSFVDEDGMVKRMGIVINEDIDGKPEFIHRTFAEYFAAVFLMKTLEEDSRNQQVWEFFISQVFMSPEQETIRAFLNCLLLRGSNLPENEPWEFDVPNNCDDLSRTVYHIAAEEGNAGILRFCLKRLTKQHELKPLNIDGRKSLYEYTYALLQQKADIDLEDFRGRRVLDSALMTNRYGTLDVVKCLVEWGADLNRCNSVGRVPLHSAAASGNLEVFEYLLERGAELLSKDGAGDTVLHRAVGAGSFKIVEYILKTEKGIGIHTMNKFGKTPLFRAVDNNNLDMIECLQQNANLLTKNQNGTTALHYAAQNGSFEVVNYLLTMGQGIDINIKDEHGDTPLHSAVSKSDNLAMVKYLHEKGADLLSKNENGITALHYAARDSNLEVVKYILTMGQGIDINIKNKDGETPLHLAASTMFNLDVVKYLHVKGADLLSKNENGTTVLHYAARSRSSGIVEYILTNEQGIDIDIKDNDGKTPLHFAASISCNDSMVKYLHKKGAYLFSKSANGTTVLDCAIKVQCRETVEYIRSRLWNQVHRY